MDYSNIFGILLLSFICKSSIFKQDFMSNKFYSGDFKFIFPTFRINSLLSGTYLNINCPIPDYFRLSQLLSNTWFLCAISSIFDFFFFSNITCVRTCSLSSFFIYFILLLKLEYHLIHGWLSFMLNASSCCIFIFLSINV